MNILIAEDDLHIRQGLQDMLSAEGYEVLAAENGRVALNLFAKHRVDFIILDIMMPELDGFSVCREVRQKNAQVPILFLSAKSEEIDKVLGLELGADDYINKPFSLAELRARIRAITRRCLSQNNQADNLSFLFGDLVVYPDELQAVRQTEQGEKSISLSLREIRLLTCLQQNQGRVVSRDMLFDAAWGYDHMPNSRTLDQHISKLRKHIEINPADPKLIQTVHGQGYRYAG